LRCEQTNLSILTTQKKTNKGCGNTKRVVQWATVHPLRPVIIAGNAGHRRKLNLRRRATPFFFHLQDISTPAARRRLTRSIAGLPSPERACLELRRHLHPSNLFLFPNRFLVVFISLFWGFLRSTILAPWFQNRNVEV